MLQRIPKPGVKAVRECNNLKMTHYPAGNVHEWDCDFATLVPALTRRGWLAIFGT